MSNVLPFKRPEPRPRRPRPRPEIAPEPSDEPFRLRLDELWPKTAPRHGLSPAPLHLVVTDGSTPPRPLHRQVALRPLMRQSWLRRTWGKIAARLRRQPPCH